MSEPLKVFITYSHKDTGAKNELIKRLSVLTRENRIRIWQDNEILPGDKWREAISTNLTDSDLLLYLVSADSLASQNCNKELSDALALAEQKKVMIRTIPIILERCDWLNHQLSEFQALPDKGKPINEWQPESQGWQNVVDGIRKIIDSQTKVTATREDQQERLVGWVLQQGNFLLMLGQVEKAIEAYSHAIKVKRNFVAYNNRGVTYVVKGDHDQAIQDYGKAIALNPDNAEPYCNRGIAYRKKGDHDQAIQDFDKAIDLNPDDAGAYYNRGVTYGEKGDLDRAIQDFDKAIDLKPDYAEAYNNRGVAYRKKDEHARAIQDYDKAVALKPDAAEAYSNRGIAYGEKGDHDQAIQDYGKAIDLKPDDAEAYQNRGLAYVRQGEFARAIQDFDKAIELKPDLAEAYYLRGVTWLVLKEWDKARSDLTTAKNRGVGVVELSSTFGSVSNFERTFNVQLPNDIAEMLTP